MSGLGSNRYDFFRVALDEFEAHPVAGIGVDNFQEQYLRRGRSDETPRYPHSVELRTLTETGLIGALLAVVGLAAALVAGWRAMRRVDDALGAIGRGGRFGGLCLLGGPWLVRLVLGVRRPRRPRVRPARGRVLVGACSGARCAALSETGGGGVSRADSLRTVADGGDVSCVRMSPPRAQGGLRGASSLSLLAAF